MGQDRTELGTVPNSGKRRFPCFSSADGAWDLVLLRILSDSSGGGSCAGFPTTSSLDRSVFAASFCSCVYHALRRFGARRGCREATSDYFRATPHQHLLHRWLVRGAYQQVPPQREDRALRAAPPQAWLRRFALRGSAPISVLGSLLATAFDAYHPSHTKGLTRRCS